MSLKADRAKSARQQKSDQSVGLFLFDATFEPNLIRVTITSYPKCEYPTFKIVLHFKKLHFITPLYLNSLFKGGFKEVSAQITVWRHISWL